MADQLPQVPPVQAPSFTKQEEQPKADDISHELNINKRAAREEELKLKADEAKQPEAPPQERQKEDRFGPPEQLDPEGDYVHIPTLVADEFGVTRSVATEEIRKADIEINGQRWDGDKLVIPAEELVGKTLTVRGQERSFVIRYKVINEG